MDNIERAFWQFHGAHPEVYDRLVSLARRTKAAGIRHYGIKALYEVARWQTHLGSKSDEFRLNNNYTAHYARLIMMNCADLVGFFHVRHRQPETLEDLPAAVRLDVLKNANKEPPWDD